jgi:all-trans-retinol dehydrogenase (NAD+)
VDILINNAGIVSGKKIFESSYKTMEKTMNVNSVAHFYTIKELLPTMIKRNRGHIVTISSQAGLLGVSGLIDYCASKFAVFGMNESLRHEL